MGKLIILKLGEGNFEQGFPVTFQVGEENARPIVEITGELPPNPDILRCYHRWQSIYNSLKLPARPIGLSKVTTASSSIEECICAAEELKNCLNSWLQSDLFRPIREKWLEKLIPSEPVRILLQTNNLWLQKLPWHLWDLLERYPQAEIALSAPAYEQVARISPTNAAVKILAILGDSQGIDTQADRVLLEQLPNTDITFLVEPERKDLTDQLWEQPWQILFFAGHSSSLETGDTGLISINQDESLTITQLKYGLKKAVERGLQLAIFNSCDGLGLARSFADLQIPQMIVMREPVPDRVAQEFLKHFLAAFARGESLYIAVREARERLQGLENQFPCATWLPVIYQNPAEIPLNWQELVSDNILPLSDISSISKIKKSRQQLVKQKLAVTLALLTSVVTTGLIMGVRYLGFLQALELSAFDYLLRLRPHEKPDSRILVVTVTEQDVQAQPESQRQGSLSDASLDKLLEKLEAYQPAAVGLDIYRDYPAQKYYPQLIKRMQKSDRFVGVCQVSNSSKEKLGVKPPPEVSPEGIGFSDIAIDADNVVRRHLLALTPPPSSACAAHYALNVQLALRYLYTKGIKLQFTSDGAWQLGQLKFKPLEPHTAAYQKIDALGHQIFLNYRLSPTPEAISPTITLKEVLADKLNASAVKDRIVLIGTTAETFRDYWSTPYTNPQGNPQTIPGVILQAQMVSQVVSAVLDGRPFLRSWPIESELIWVWSWSFLGGILAVYLPRLPYLALASGITIIILYGISFSILIAYSYWIPLIPAILALGSSSLIVSNSKLIINNSL